MDIIQIAKQFCEKRKVGRWDIDKFHFKYGHLIATDGRIMARFKMDGKPAGVEYAEKYPEVDDILATPAGPNRVLVSDNYIETKIRCDDCAGTGKLSKKCSVCKGEGVHGDCPTCGHERDCDECDGTGWVLSDEACEACGGVGKLDGAKDYVINSHYRISGKYIYLINKLPGAALFIDANISDDKPISIKFTFDGGDGVVMPLIHKQ